MTHFTMNIMRVQRVIIFLKKKTHKMSFFHFFPIVNLFAMAISAKSTACFCCCFHYLMIRIRSNKKNC